MALIHCKFFSETLKLSCEMDVILPQKTQSQVGMEGKTTGGEHPVLYLLHGMSDDHTIWQRRTSIERYVAPMGLAVVMPAVHRSYYTDQANGYRYWTYISEEVPSLAQSFFNLSDKREDNFVAGLSMGGYGAMKLGLRCPDRFAAAATLSGALDVASREKKTDPHPGHDYCLAFGNPPKVKNTENDLLHLAEQVAKEGKDIKLYQCCGTEDFLYEENLTFKAHAEKLGLDLTYEEGPGTHEWGYWDRMIQNVLQWLPL